MWKQDGTKNRIRLFLSLYAFNFNQNYIVSNSYAGISIKISGQITIILQNNLF